MAKYLRLYSDGCEGTKVGGLYDIPDTGVLKGWFERTPGVFEAYEGETLLVEVPETARPWVEEEGGE